MRAERLNQRQITVVQGKPIEEALRRAVRHALLDHKRVGNTIASWQEDRIVLIPAEEIQIVNDTKSNSGEC